MYHKLFVVFLVFVKVNFWGFFSYFTHKYIISKLSK